MGGQLLVYLDNAVTTQVPEQVFNVAFDHYRTNSVNVHRGIHTLSNRSAAALETACRKVQRFIGAEQPTEVVFTRGTTDSLNMLVRMMEGRVSSGDTVLVSLMESAEEIDRCIEALEKTLKILSLQTSHPSATELCEVRTCRLQKRGSRHTFLMKTIKQKEL